MMVTTTDIAAPDLADNQIVRTQPQGMLPNANIVEYLTQDTTTLPHPLPRVIRLRWAIDNQGLRMQWSQHEA
jgi:hypothetical protein